MAASGADRRSTEAEATQQTRPDAMDAKRSRSREKAARRPRVTFGVGKIGRVSEVVRATDLPSAGASQMTGRRGRLSSRRPEPESWVLFAAVALVPIAVATARAIHRGWLPLGDNNPMYIRSVDVFSSRRVAASAGQSLSPGNLDAKELLGLPELCSTSSSRASSSSISDGPRSLERYRYLQTAADQHTVAIFAAPLGGPGVERLRAPKRP